jgi:hypothetical protein
MNPPRKPVFSSGIWKQWQRKPVEDVTMQKTCQPEWLSTFSARSTRPRQVIVLPSVSANERMTGEEAQPCLIRGVPLDDSLQVRDNQTREEGSRRVRAVADKRLALRKRLSQARNRKAVLGINTRLYIKLAHVDCRSVNPTALPSNCQ